MNEPPEFSHWKEAWEWYASQTGQAYDQLSEGELLQQIEAGRYDGYYTIWYSLRRKGSLARSAPVLIEVLRREQGDENNLIRYHCAAALFYLLGYPDEPIPALRARVQWAHNGEDDRQAAIDDLERLVQQQIAGLDT